MKIHLVAAIDNNNGIGKNNDLPWPRLKEDMKFFKRTTERWPTIMGRKTYESIPKNYRPLSNRQNIVLSRTRRENLGVTYECSLDLALAQAQHWDKVFIVGGGSLYKEVLEKDLVDAMYLTHVKHNFDCDTYFPPIDYNIWDSFWIDYGCEPAVNFGKDKAIHFEMKMYIRKKDKL